MDLKPFYFYLTKKINASENMDSSCQLIVQFERKYLKFKNLTF